MPQSDDDDDFEGFDDDDGFEDSGDEDGEESVEDTWAALKKLKAAKSGKGKPVVADDDEPKTADDTWAALKKLKAAKQKKKAEPEHDEPETAEDTWAALKKLKEAKSSKKKAKPSEEPESVEDTWAALKRAKESKNKKKTKAISEDEEEPASVDDTWAALKKLKEKKNASKKSSSSAVADTMEQLRLAKENKKKLEKDALKQDKKKKTVPKKKEEAPKKKGRSLADLLGSSGDAPSAKNASGKPTIRKGLSAQDREALERDDEDIAFYSRMLGLKDPDDKLPALEGDDDDGLEGLLDGLDFDFDEEDDEDDAEAKAFPSDDEVDLDSDGVDDAGSDEEDVPSDIEEGEDVKLPFSSDDELDSDDFDSEVPSDIDDDDEPSEKNEDEDTKLPFSSDDELDSDDFDSDVSSDINMEELNEVAREEDDESSANEDEEDEEDEDGDSDASDASDASDDEEESKPKRENPYVAPVPASTQKYIPPSVRKRMLEEAQQASTNGTADASGLSSEEMARLRRQVKGQLNRLTDTNMAGIVKTLSDMYLHHPRQYMNEVITSTVVESIALQGTLSEKFLAVHAALVAALYRTAGLEFGAHFVQTLVEEFDRRYYSGSMDEKQDVGAFQVSNKEAANLISLLAELYSFNIVWCGIVYDFVREFLKPAQSGTDSIVTGGLDEAKTELLLRVLRAAGSQLRADDPRALRDIVVKLNELKASASQRGEQLSSRTLFMISFIEDLKNNKQKRGGADISETARETRKQMRDFLNAHVKAPKREALRVSLEDIRNVATRGKWWLVGSAWRSKNMAGETHEDDEDAEKSPEDFVDKKALQDILDTAEPNWMELARQQRMNTDIRRAIFIAIMSSGDYVDAVDRIQQLKLRSKQEREIARVLLRCCTVEQVYNPFYALVATRLCSTERALGKTFTFCLYDFLGETEGEDSDDEREGMGRLYDEEDGGDDMGDEEDGDGAMQKIRMMKLARKKKLRQQHDRDSGLSTEQVQQRLRKTVHLAKFYGTLVALGALPLIILKTANMVAPSPDTAVFLDLFFITLLTQVSANGGVGMPGSNTVNGKKQSAGTAKMGVGLASAMFERKLDPESERGLVHLVAQTAGKGKLKQQKRAAGDSDDDEDRGRNAEEEEGAGIGLLRKIRHYLPRVLNSDLLEDELAASAAVAFKKSRSKRAARVQEDMDKIKWAVNLIVDAVDELLERTGNTHRRAKY